MGGSYYYNNTWNPSAQQPYSSTGQPSSSPGSVAGSGSRSYITPQQGQYGTDSAPSYSPMGSTTPAYGSLSGSRNTSGSGSYRAGAAAGSYTNPAPTT
ncbi:unnamed protein product, partial [marine sediment metagenome]